MLRRLKNRLLLWIMQTTMYKWLLFEVVPFVRFTTYYASIRGNKYHEGYRLLSPGDIILTVDNKKLTSLLIPGTMTHAALCLFKRPPHDTDSLKTDGYEIVEMTHTNYTRSDFFDLCKEADRVVILNCLDWDDDYIARVIESAKKLQNAKYDVEFDLGVEALYCSELVYQADVSADCFARNIEPYSWNSRNEKYGRLQVDLSDLAGLGRKYISPDGLLFAKNVRCIWDSDGVFQGLTGEQIERKLEV